jgi:hypothetical protein
LKIYIHNLAILVDSPPEIMLLAIDLLARHTGEDFIDVEGVTVASVLSFESACINGTEFDAPKTDRFAADGDVSLGQEIFNISVAEVESVVEPDGIGDDVGWESVSLVCIHPSILSVTAI